MSRGRPSESVERLDKWTLDTTDYDGSRSIIKFDTSKSPKGPYSIEYIPPKGFRQPKPDIDQRMYGKNPVVMVFKTSNRSNAKTKIKVFNKNIDYVISAKKLPGVPEKAEILELAVGKSYIDKYKQKYNLS
jgi:hypothetical protein